MQPAVLFTVKQSLGLVMLNRPQMLNALNLAMVHQLKQQLIDWETSSTIQAVCIIGAGERAFCAGADLRTLYTMREYTSEFFRQEYQLNQLIKYYKKPYIAITDGITMGGGVGLSQHSMLRIATERLLWAMPETGIGFFPDVGSSYFLPRCPGKLGFYLGLIGISISAADAIYANLIDNIINSHAVPIFIERLAHAPSLHLADIKRVLAEFSITPNAQPLATHRQYIDDCFSQPTIEKIIERLKTYQNTWANDTLALLHTRSPTSLKITLKQLQKGTHLDFMDCMNMEQQLANSLSAQQDFYEGIRAVIIDKDQQPHWRPDTLEAVDLQWYSHIFPDG